MRHIIRRLLTGSILAGGSAALLFVLLASLNSQPNIADLATLTQIAVRATLTERAQRQPSPTVIYVLRTEPATTLTPVFPTITSTASSTPPPSLIDLTPATITPAGEVALVSADTRSVSGQPTAVLHIVQLRESVYRIAQQYDVSVDAISAANALPDPSRIMVGQALLIPVGGTVQPPLHTPTTVYPAVATALAQVGADGLGNPALEGSLLLTPTPTLPPPPATVNGLAIDAFVVMDEAVRANIRSIYGRGQADGRGARAFSKLGDSTIENPHFMTRFDTGVYHLGDYAYLQRVIEQYQGSFGRQGVAVRRGLHTWSVLDPMWAPKPTCAPGEHMLACEFRLHNPSVLFVRMGSNDKGIPNSTDRNLRRIVEFAIENGVIPIMGTKADRFEGGDNTNNQIIRQIAADYHLPLWDFDLVAGTLPGRGLGPDRVHMTPFYAHDWRNPLGFQTGNGLHNLTALIMLDRVWQIIDDGQ